MCASFCSAKSAKLCGVWNAFHLCFILLINHPLGLLTDPHLNKASFEREKIAVVNIFDKLRTEAQTSSEIDSLRAHCCLGIKSLMLISVKHCFYPKWLLKWNAHSPFFSVSIWSNLLRACDCISSSSVGCLNLGQRVSTPLKSALNVALVSALILYEGRQSKLCYILELPSIYFLNKCL